MKYKLNENLEISIIAAMTENGRVIGKNNKIPWNYPEELLHFKETTMGGAVIFGRHTWESINKPLPGRLNIVLSKNLSISDKNLFSADSIENAIKLAAGKGYNRIYICGGQSIYSQTINLAKTLILTKIKQDFTGDAFFPQFDENLFYIEEKKNTELYKILIYRRK